MKRSSVGNVCVLLSVLVNGCAAVDKPDTQFGVANRSQRIAPATTVSQRSGRDAVNLSPSIAVTGSSGLAVVVLVAMWRELRRSRRALRAVVAAVETLDKSYGCEVKTRIAQKALVAKVADYLHRIVTKEIRPQPCNSQYKRG